MSRKRIFAAPFVLTSALAACGSPTGGADEPIHRNPPPPEQEAPPPEVVQPDPAQTLPDAPTGEGGRVEKREDGTCWYISPAPTCPPNTMCNPPPPRQVKCAE